MDTQQTLAAVMTPRTSIDAWIPLLQQCKEELQLCQTKAAQHLANLQSNVFILYMEDPYTWDLEKFLEEEPLKLFLAQKELLYHQKYHSNSVWMKQPIDPFLKFEESIKKIDLIAAILEMIQIIYQMPADLQRNADYFYLHSCGIHPDLDVNTNWPALACTFTTINNIISRLQSQVCNMSLNR